MAKGKSRQVSSARKAEIKSGLKALKKAGLYKGDLRSAKGNSYQASLVKKYADVISGKSVAVKLDTKTAHTYRDTGAPVKNNRLVVAAEKGEKIRYNKRTKEIEGVRRAYGESIFRRVFYQKTFDPQKLPVAKGKQKFYYRADFGQGHTPRFEDRDEFIKFMMDYRGAEHQSERARIAFQKFWMGRVDIEEVIKGDIGDLDD